MYVGLHVDCLLFLSDFNQTWIVSTEFVKPPLPPPPNTQFHETPSSGSRVVQSGTKNSHNKAKQ
jgi:hypothetical protein